MSNITIQDLYDLNETIAAELFDGLDLSVGGTSENR